MFLGKMILQIPELGKGDSYKANFKGVKFLREIKKAALELVVMKLRMT